MFCCGSNTAPRIVPSVVCADDGATAAIKKTREKSAAADVTAVDG
jgi:hypothetical protein